MKFIIKFIINLTFLFSKLNNQERKEETEIEDWMPYFYCRGNR